MGIFTTIKKTLIRYPANRTPSSPTVLFLFRGLPDLDHMVPVAYKLSKTVPDLKIEFCCTNIRFGFHQTQLYRFLTEELCVRAVYLHKLYTPTLFHKWFSKYLVYQEVITDSVFSKVFNRINREKLKHILYDSRYYSSFLEYGNICSIVIETLSTEKRYPHHKWFYGAILPFALKHQISVYWMHHAPPVTNNQLNFDQSIGINKGIKFISTFLVCSEWVKNYYISTGLKAEEIKVVGNPRYCREWLEKWDDYLQFAQYDIGNTNLDQYLSISDLAQPKMLRVIVIESAPHGTILNKYFELINVLRKHERVRLKVLPHPRREVSFLSNDYPELIIDKSHPSSNLIQWCDVAIVAYSSLVWECFERNKYVIHTDYISNRQFDYLFSNNSKGRVGLYASNTEEVITLIKEISEGNISCPIDDPAYLYLRKNVIYGGLAVDSVLKGHTAEISKSLKN